MAFDQIKVELCSSWGVDRDIANAAWASSTDLTKLSAKQDSDIMRVVTGLVNLHHDTPKERCWMEFFITCPIFVERQFDKYRMTLQEQQFTIEWYEAPMGRDHITQNELSGRYRTIPDRPYTLPNDISALFKRVDDSGNEDTIFTSKGYWDSALRLQHEYYEQQLIILKKAESNKVITNKEYKRAREVLRGMLGTAFLTDMRIVMNMNAFEHIVNQRLAADAQLESRVVAYLMVKKVVDSGICPVLINEMIVANKWASLMDEVESKF